MAGCSGFCSSTCPSRWLAYRRDRSVCISRILSIGQIYNRYCIEDQSSQCAGSAQLSGSQPDHQSCKGCNHRHLHEPMRYAQIVIGPAGSGKVRSCRRLTSPICLPIATYLGEQMKSCLLHAVHLLRQCETTLRNCWALCTCGEPRYAVGPQLIHAVFTLEGRQLASTYQCLCKLALQIQPQRSFTTPLPLTSVV